MTTPETGVQKGVLVGWALGSVVLLAWVLTGRIGSRYADERTVTSSNTSESVGASAAEPAPRLQSPVPIPDSRPAERPERQEVGLNNSEPQETTKNQGLSKEPYELFVESLTKSEDTETIARDILFYHSKIMNSPDDPEWARKMEKDLLEYVMRNPYADSIEPVSIKCRSAGCELQLFHEPKSQAPLSLLMGIPAQFPTLRPSFEMKRTVEGRFSQIMFLIREEPKNPEK